MIFRKLTGKLATVSWHVDVSKFCSMQSKVQQESASLLFFFCWTRSQVLHTSYWSPGQSRAKPARPGERDRKWGSVQINSPLGLPNGHQLWQERAAALSAHPLWGWLFFSFGTEIHHVVVLCISKTRTSQLFSLWAYFSLLCNNYKTEEIASWHHLVSEAGLHALTITRRRRAADYQQCLLVNPNQPQLSVLKSEQEVCVITS